VEFPAQPIGNRLSPHRELALACLTAHVREAEKVKRLRFPGNRHPYRDPLFIAAPIGILSTIPIYTPGIDTVPPFRQHMIASR
jgi:hypothetical protein